MTELGDLIKIIKLTDLIDLPKTRNSAFCRNCSACTNSKDSWAAAVDPVENHKLSNVVILTKFQFY